MVHASIKIILPYWKGCGCAYLPHVEFLNKYLMRVTLVNTFHLCLSWAKFKRRQEIQDYGQNSSEGCSFRFGVYVVSLSQMILGTPKTILAKSIFTEQGVDAKTSMIFEYDNGQIANLSCSMYDSQPNRAVISGREWMDRN
ncbi:MAG: hypothetical protein CM15mP106_5170 [Candidatus Neomarinimicrobiota bacterium]|nr:MAG: hypothetical protein CM15mP106_5170 [Candidatus Neomarinimicrobiota bacterium]